MDGFPAIPCGYRSVGSEYFSFHIELLGRRELPQAVGQRVAGAHAIVSDRPHVEAAQLEDQEHLGGPPSDATDDREACDDLLVAEPADAVERTGSIQDALGKIADGGDLASREPRGAKLSGRERQDGLGREASVEQGDKPSMDRTRRGACQLLIKDALGEGGKVAGGRPWQVEPFGP